VTTPLALITQTRTPGDKPEPSTTRNGIHNWLICVAMAISRLSPLKVQIGGSVRVAHIRGLITQRDEDPSHIKEPADQAPARSSGLGLQARPEHPGLR
jgi:hypothetical protein